MIGKTFNRLTVVKLSDKTYSNGTKLYTCLCYCGQYSEASAGSLVSGHTKSCGCLVRETIGKLNRTHGKSRTPEYRVWKGMRGRCLNANNPKFPNYGGRGIRITERWENFDAFLSDMGRRPSSRHSIDRIDVDGDYCPDNCRWATSEEQAINRTDTKYIDTPEGVMPMKVAANRYGLNYMTLKSRVRKGKTGSALFSKKSHRDNGALKGTGEHKKPVLCLDTGIYYESLSEAYRSRVFAFSPASLWNKLNGVSRNQTSLIWA